MTFLRGRYDVRPRESDHGAGKPASQEIFDAIRPASRGRDPFRTNGERRIPRRYRNMLLAAIAPMVAIGVMATFFWSGSDPADAPVAHEEPGPNASPLKEPPPPFDATRRGYAIALPELDGLPDNAAPGTRLELWVAWDPPITKEPRVQRLLKDVVLEEVVPPSVPEAPATAVLSVMTKSVPDLLFGDRYGALSVTLLPGAD